eukprot:g18244.t1
MSASSSSAQPGGRRTGIADEEQSLYDILEVAPSATADEIKVAYRNLSRIHHPDKKRRTAAGAHSEQPLSSAPSGTDHLRGQAASPYFLQVERAYRILSDVTLRQFYDKYGESGIQIAEKIPREKYDPTATAGEADADGDKVSVPPRPSASAPVSFSRRGPVAGVLRRREDGSNRTSGGGSRSDLEDQTEEGPTNMMMEDEVEQDRYSTFQHGVHLYNEHRTTIALFSTAHLVPAVGGGLLKLIMQATHRPDAATTVRVATGSGLFDGSWSSTANRPLPVATTSEGDEDFRGLVQRSVLASVPTLQYPLDWQLTRKLSESVSVTLQLATARCFGPGMLLWVANRVWQNLTSALGGCSEWARATVLGSKMNVLELDASTSTSTSTLPSDATESDTPLHSNGATAKMKRKRSVTPGLHRQDVSISSPAAFYPRIFSASALLDCLQAIFPSPFNGCGIVSRLGKKTVLSVQLDRSRGPGSGPTDVQLHASVSRKLTGKLKQNCHYKLDKHRIELQVGFVYSFREVLEFSCGLTANAAGLVAAVGRAAAAGDSDSTAEPSAPSRTTRTRAETLAPAAAGGTTQQLRMLGFVVSQLLQPSGFLAVEVRNVPDELSKITWTLQADQRALRLRVGLRRAGLNYEIPLEIVVRDKAAVLGAGGSDSAFLEVLLGTSCVFALAPLVPKILSRLPDFVARCNAKAHERTTALFGKKNLSS